MPDIEIDKLQIEVSASSEDATKKIRSLASAFRSLKKSLSENGAVSTMANALESLSFSTGDSKNIAEMADAIKKIGSQETKLGNVADYLLGISKMDFSNLTSASNVIGELAEIASSVKNKVQAQSVEPNTGAKDSGEEETEIIKQKINLLLDLKQRLAEIRASFKERTKLSVDSSDVNKAKNDVSILNQAIISLKKTFNSIKRIAFYRAIRSAIKYVSSAFNEGLENAYRFSQITNGPLAAALDNISTKSFQLNNQLGAALGTLITQLEPTLVRLIGLINQIAQGITWIFAVFSGSETYLVANKIAKSWKDADKAAKAYRRTLIGIDEINRLTENNAGALTGINFEDLFHREEIDYTSNEAQFVVKLKDVLFEWENYTPELVASKALAAVFGVSGGIIGWSLAGPIGGLIGLTVGAALGVKIADVLFNNDGKLNSEEIASLVMTAVFGIGGGIIGWAIGGPVGAAIGLFVGASLGFGISQILFNFDGNLSDEEKLKAIMTAVFGAVGGIIGWSLGGPIGSAIGLTVGVGLSLVLQGVIFNNDGEVSIDEILISAITVLGGIAGGIIGFSIGGPLGAVIGAVVGVGLTLSLKNVLFSSGEAKTDFLMETLISTLTMVGGGLLGFAIGGPIGAVIGVTVGAGISMIINEALFGSGEKDLKDTVMESLATVLNGLLGGMIGFAVGGPIGAALGATIGVAISLLAKSVDISSVKAKVSSAIDGISSFFSISNTTPQTSGSFGSGGRVRAFASGGFPEDGLFYANHGELVGQFSNGRTAVANNEQIVDGIENGVRDANQELVSVVSAGFSQIINAIERGGNGGGDLDMFANAFYPVMQGVSARRGLEI